MIQALNNNVIVKVEKTEGDIAWAVVESIGQKVLTVKVGNEVCFDPKHGTSIRDGLITVYEDNLCGMTV